MSALCIITTPDEVVISTDGGGYYPDGTLGTIGGKLIFAPEASAIVTGRGSKLALDCMSDLVSNSPHRLDFDAILALAPSFVEQVACSIAANDHDHHPRFSIYIAGWSKGRQAHEAWSVRSWSSEVTPPFTLKRLPECYLAPEPPQEFADVFGIQMPSTGGHQWRSDPVRYAALSICTCRLCPGRYVEDADSIPNRIMAGAFVQISSVSSKTIRSEIFHEWPDMIGSKVNPMVGSAAPGWPDTTDEAHIYHELVGSKPKSEECDSGQIYHGEFIVNAGATARNRGVLEAINAGRVAAPGFATGGVLDAVRLGAASQAGSLTRDDVLGRRGAIPVSLATDSSSAAMLRDVMSGAMYEALRRVRDEGGGDGSLGGGSAEGDHHAAPSIRYGRQHSGSGGGADSGGRAAMMSGVVAGRARDAMAQLEGLGWSHEAAAAAIGNAQQESGVRSDGPLGDTARFGTGDDAAYGMFQWRGQRFRDLKAFAAERGKEWTDFKTQVSFFDQESKKYGSAEWRSSHDILHANRGMKRFEGYGDDSFGQRLANARQIAAGKSDGGFYPADVASGGAPGGGAAPAGDALATAGALNGMSSAQAAKALGHVMHAGQWCADFVNGVIEKSGGKGSGSSMAQSFHSWGKHVDFGDVKRGDVIVEDHGRGRGHVGLATGAVKRDAAGNVVAIGMTSGNHGNRVVSDYMERVGEINELRRGNEEVRREAERAVLPRKAPATAPAQTPEHQAMSGGLDFDHSGVREAIHHVRTLKQELASLGTANVDVKHRGFGDHGDHAPGRVRAALNGNFGSDGRGFS